MDAYDVAEGIKKVWAATYDKRSGQINKKTNEMVVMVHTDEGFREVIGVTFNPDINAIQLIVDGE